MSHHLQCFKTRLLVRAEGDGRTRYYGIVRPEGVRLIDHAVEFVRRNIEGVLNSGVVRPDDS